MTAVVLLLGNILDSYLFRAYFSSIVMVLGVLMLITAISEKKKHKNLKPNILRNNVLGQTVNSFKVTSNKLSKLEQDLVLRSGIYRWIRWIRIEHIILMSSGLMITVTAYSLYKIGFKPYAFVPGTILFIMPFISLDLLRKYNAQKSRKLLVTFISSIHRWSNIKEDIVYCFEKTLNMGIGDPIDSYLREFIVQVNSGLSTIKALEIFQDKVDNEFFRTFIINIKHSVKCKGNLSHLLSNLEEEAYKIEEEFDRRKISMFKDKLVVYFIMILTLMVFVFQLKTNRVVSRFYFTTGAGGILLTIYSVLFFIGILMSFDLNKADY